MHLSKCRSCLALCREVNWDRHISQAWVPGQMTGVAQQFIKQNPLPKKADVTTVQISIVYVSNAHVVM